MDRSVSWTNAESIAALLARTSGPRRAVAQAIRNAPRFARASSPAKPAETPPSTIVTAPPVVVAQVRIVPKLEQPSDNPSDRLDALLAWTLDHQQCTGAFVADDNGLTLAAHGISEAHVALVGPLLSALMGVRSIPGIDATAGALWLGENMMSWVEARTMRGGFCLGTVGAEALPTQALNQMKEALETTVQGL